MTLAETKTIPQLAKESGLNRWTLFRRLMKLHAEHGGDWLYRGKRNIRVNIPALRAMHPSLFPPVDLHQVVEAIQEDVAETKHEARENTRAIGALTQRVRALELARMQL